VEIVDLHVAYCFPSDCPYSIVHSGARAHLFLQQEELVIATTHGPTITFQQRDDSQKLAICQTLYQRKIGGNGGAATLTLPTTRAPSLLQLERKVAESKNLLLITFADRVGGPRQLFPRGGVQSDDGLRSSPSNQGEAEARLQAQEKHDNE
jgi:hypothetical protein